MNTMTLGTFLNFEPLICMLQTTVVPTSLEGSKSLAQCLAPLLVLAIIIVQKHTISKQLGGGERVR